MKALARTMVLVLLLGVMGASMVMLVSASEDIPPADEAETAVADFAADEEMMRYSAAAQAAASIVVSDATSVYVGNLENAPALQVDYYLVDTADGEVDDEADEYLDDEDGEYEEPMAINDAPDTGRVSMTLAASAALLACALSPMVLKKK